MNSSPLFSITECLITAILLYECIQVKQILHFQEIQKRRARTAKKRNHPIPKLHDCQPVKACNWFALFAWYLRICKRPALQAVPTNFLCKIPIWPDTSRKTCRKVHDLSHNRFWHLIQMILRCIDKVMVLRLKVFTGSIRPAISLKFKIDFTSKLCSFDVPVLESFVAIAHGLLNGWHFIEVFLQLFKVFFERFEFFDRFCAADFLACDCLNRFHRTFCSLPKKSIYSL